MVRQQEDHKTHLHRVASSNLPIIPRKSWEYYVAILQPGIPLEKCEHGDFLWMKVKGMVTVEKILKSHFERTGRNSILMDGGIGLTIDTKVEDIQCLGLGVYAFWEIVKVERWWEYRVRPTDVDESLGMMKEAKNADLRKKKFRPTLEYEEMGLMQGERSKERLQNTSAKGAPIVKKEENRWSWETTVPPINLDGAAIGSRSRARWVKDAMIFVSKFMTGKEKPVESSTSTKIPPIEIKEESRGSGRSKKSGDLKRKLTKEDRGQAMKRRRMDLENESDAMAKRRRTKLDKELELVGLKNKNAPTIDNLETLAESTSVELRRHDDSVKKQRKNMSTKAKKLREGQYKEMLQRFEISWEWQRQDIINRYPQFRRSRDDTQTLSGGSNAKSSLNHQVQEQKERTENQSEIPLHFEPIQEQLDVEKRQYSHSSFTLRYSHYIVHLECGFCPHMDICFGLRDARKVMGRAKSHQESKDHMDRYFEVRGKEIEK
ncbi:hypothetical protein EAF04_005930 [Stromatinia cepivora]|nr:hypothetical protein EAF04_005930 [Stromatinia cepivora]